jgi:hypothetical protein
VADMALEPLAQLVELGHVRVGPGREVLRAAAQVDVLDQHPHDRVPVGLGAARKGWEQHLLLDTEVPSALPLEEVQERLSRLRRRAGVGTFQLQGHEQPLMVVAGEGGESLAALHRRDHSRATDLVCTPAADR